jgi:arylsulfatase A
MKQAPVLLFVLLAVVQISSMGTNISCAEERRPNVVFFLVDDLGWRDLECYGSSFYETPNIDRFAEQGVRFTQAYAACHVCSPTRASIMTGKYPARLRLTDWLSGRREFPFQKLKNAEIHQQLPLDIGEQNDLSQAGPEKTAELRSMPHDWRKDMSARMMPPNPEYDSAREQ